MSSSNINRPFLDMRIAGLSERVIEKNLRLNKMQLVRVRRPFYCVSNPVEQNQQWCSGGGLRGAEPPLLKFHVEEPPYNF
jgi:hypothetical protein